MSVYVFACVYVYCNIIICNIIIILQFNDRLSGSRPDLLEPISFGSEVRLLALEQELQELREQISTIVKNNKLSKCTYKYMYFVIFKVTKKIYKSLEIYMSYRCICYIFAQWSGQGKIFANTTTTSTSSSATHNTTYREKS